MRHLSDPVEAVVNVWPCQRLLSALWKLNSPMCTWLELSVKPQERNGRRERETETGGLQVASRISDGTVQDRSRPRTSRQRCGRRVCLVSLWWSCRHSWIEEGWRWEADGAGMRTGGVLHCCPSVSVEHVLSNEIHALPSGQTCSQLPGACVCSQMVVPVWVCVPYWNEDKCFNVKLKCSKHNGNRAAASEWRELEKVAGNAHLSVHYPMT